MKTPAKRYTPRMNRHRKLTPVHAAQSPQIDFTALLTFPPLTATVPLWEFPPVVPQPAEPAVTIKIGDAQVDLTMEALEFSRAAPRELRRGTQPMPTTSDEKLLLALRDFMKAVNAAQTAEPSMLLPGELTAGVAGIMKDIQARTVQRR